MSKLSSLVSVSLAIAMVAGAAGTARGHSGLRTARTMPSHFSVGEQYFDGNVWGLRSYLESIRSSDADLYAKLAPDLARLETRTTTAGLLLVAGVAAGVGTSLYGLTTRPNCTAPSVTDPNFAAQVSEWGSCNDRSRARLMTFTSVGLGLLLAGSIGAMVTAPRRWEYFEFMNRHNTLSPRPMRFQLGYDPNRRFAHAGATFTF